MSEEAKTSDLDNVFPEEENHAAVEIGTGLSQLEFRFLCASYGVTSLVGFEITEDAETQEEQLQVLLNMVKRGLLTQTDDGFAVSSEISEMMQCIATRISTMRIWSPDSSTPNSVIYVGQDRDAVMACPGKKKGEYAILTYLPTGTLSGFLASSDIIPDALVPQEISELGRELNKEGISAPEGKLTDRDDIRLEIRFYDGTDAEENAAVCIIWHNGQEVAVLDSGGMRTADNYVTKELIALICAQCGAEE